MKKMVENVKSFIVALRREIDIFMTIQRYVRASRKSRV